MTHGSVLRTGPAVTIGDIMVPLREWLRPPKSLLLILVLLSLVSVSAVGWFGFKLLEQDRMVQAQRRQERLEQAADRMAATLRGTLAETGERLSAWLTTPPPAGKPDDGVLLTVEENSVTAYPAGRLLYYPASSDEPEARAEVFAEGELLEFLQAQPANAAEAYRVLAESRNAAVRAGALLRLARVLGKLGRREESRAAYTRLAAISGVRVAGAALIRVRARPASSSIAMYTRLAMGKSSAGRPASASASRTIWTCSANAAVGADPAPKKASPSRTARRSAGSLDPPNHSGG